jgi:uncharacterized protein YodC (DUF2158 family)
MKQGFRPQSEACCGRLRERVPDRLARSWLAQPSLKEAPMSTTELKIGDVVRLKSGSPFMTVVAFGKDGQSNARVTCTWFDKDQHEQTGIFPIDAVEVTSRPSGGGTRIASSVGVNRRSGGDGTGWMGR